MITKDHLQHWLKEINYQLGGIDSKIGSEDRSEDHSFDYIAEKTNTIHSLIRIFICGCIETKNDTMTNLRFKCNSHKKNGYLTKNWYMNKIIFNGDLKVNVD